MDGPTATPSPRVAAGPGPTRPQRPRHPAPPGLLGVPACGRVLLVLENMEGTSVKFSKMDMGSLRAGRSAMAERPAAPSRDGGLPVAGQARPSPCASPRLASVPYTYPCVAGAARRRWTEERTAALDGTDLQVRNGVVCAAYDARQPAAPLRSGARPVINPSRGASRSAPVRRWCADRACDGCSPGV